MENGAAALLVYLSRCKRCEGKHMIITDSGHTASGGFYTNYDICPDCLRKVKEFAEG